MTADELVIGLRALVDAGALTLPTLLTLCIGHYQHADILRQFTPKRMWPYVERELKKAPHEVQQAYGLDVATVERSDREREERLRKIEEEEMGVRRRIFRDRSDRR